LQLTRLSSSTSCALPVSLFFLSSSSSSTCKQEGVVCVRECQQSQPIANRKLDINQQLSYGDKEERLHIKYLWLVVFFLVDICHSILDVGKISQWLIWWCLISWTLRLNWNMGWWQHKGYLLNLNCLLTDKLHDLTFVFTYEFANIINKELSVDSPATKMHIYDHLHTKRGYPMVYLLIVI